MRGWELVTGGGRVSMMGAVAAAARAGGARTVGVIPRALTGREIADEGVDELLATETMRERKALMEADAGGNMHGEFAELTVIELVGVAVKHERRGGH